MRDPAAKEDLPPLARLMGHTVHSTEATGDGRLSYHGGERAMSDMLIFNCTHGKDEAERATLPFVAANIAATAGQDAVVLCTIDAVWLGTARTALAGIAFRACRC